MPVELTVDVKFNVTPPSNQQVQQELIGAMKTWVEGLARRAQDNLSGKFLRVRSGRGIASVRARVTAIGDKITGTVGSPLFYLRILHTGFPGGEFKVGPGKKGFRVLANGQFIRVKSINHPGVTARPWLQDAMEASVDEGLLAFQAALNRIAKQATGNA